MKEKMTRRAKREVAIGWALLLPSLIFMCVFTVYPVIRSFVLSMTKYKMGMEAPEFIAFANYTRLFGSSTFWKVMRNTLYFGLMTVIPSMVLGLVLAMLVNRSGRHIGFIRTAYFYPSVMYVWRESGYLMVFFLSGLQSINNDVLEAAAIDGATGWKTFRHITLPLLAPTTLFISTIAFTNCFKLADHVIIMTEGAPNNASTLLLYYIYQQGFTNMNYGVSSTLTVIMLVILLIVSVPRFFSQDRKIHYA